MSLRAPVLSCESREQGQSNLWLPTENKGYVYMMMNPGDTVIYRVVTSDLGRRVHQHKEKTIEGFTKKV